VQYGSSAHKVTTINIRGEVFMGEETFGAPVVAAVAAGVNFLGGILFH